LSGDIAPHERFSWRSARSRAFVLRLVYSQRDEGYLEALAAHRRAILQRRYKKLSGPEGKAPGNFMLVTLEDGVLKYDQEPDLGYDASWDVKSQSESYLEEEHEYLRSLNGIPSLSEVVPV
jgi:hypothetical protein